MNHKQIQPVLPLKSVAGALLFSVFLGPVGLLYASYAGGIFMIFLGFVIICSKLIVPIILFWVGCSVWAVGAVNRFNKRMFQNRERH